MGLSDNERAANIFFVVKRLYDLPRIHDYCPDGYDRKINRMLDNVWATFLSKSRNTGYWFAGGSLDHIAFGEEDLVSIAFGASLERDTPAYPKLSRLEDNEANEYADWRDTYLPDMKKMLSYTHHATSVMRTLSIFRESEAYIYSANRYDDAFSKRLRPLTKLITTLRGMCLARFSQDPVFAKAWMTEKIIDKCITYQHDVVGKWAMSANLQHSIRMMDDNDEPMRSFKLWQLEKYKPSIEDRVMMVLRLMGTHFHYEHQHKDLVKMLTKHNETSEEKVNIDRIRLACAMMHDAYEEDDRYRRENRDEYCHFTNSNVARDEPKTLNPEED